MSEPQSLADILDENRIRLKSLRPGGHEKVRCPKCEGGRTKEASLSVTIDADGDGATWKCHRGHCGWQSGGRVKQAGRPPAAAERVIREPAPHAPAATTNRPKALYDFFALRGIERETVDLFGLYVAKHFVPPLGERSCIVFPYVFGRRVVNRKYRPPEKQPQAQEKNALPTLFNVDSIEAMDRVVWVEGEPDCLAIHQAGYPQVVTLKDGSGDKLLAEDDPKRQNDRRFHALDTHSELLGKVEAFVLAGDADEPGAVLREELARRLGRHRCLLVTWPEGCKDACDVLKAHGPEGVRAAIEAAQPYPIEGLQALQGDTLEKLFRRPPPTVMRLGVPAIDRAVRWPTEGRLIVITGLPGSGKSTFLRWAMVQSMERHARRWAMFTPEMQPWEEYAADCAAVRIGKPFRAHGDGGFGTIASMSTEERMAAEEWLRDRLYVLSSDAEEKPPTLEWLLDRARAAVLRFGVNDLGLDPWNEIEHQRGNMTETEYIGRALQMLKAFGMRHGVNVWLVAHPGKLQPVKVGGLIPAPGLYDISGSANWANKADLGITVHREDRKPTEVIVRKARFSRWGLRSNRAELDFDAITGRYFPVQADLIQSPPAGDDPYG